MKKLFIALALTLPISTAYADSWVYGGASIGSSNYEDENSLAHSFYVGTGILPWVGVEGGFTEHGKFDIEEGEMKAQSVYGALKPNMNFGPLQIYGKVGAHSWIFEADEGVSIKDDDGVDFMWSVGVDYTFIGPVALGIEYTSYNIKSEMVSTVNATATVYLF